MPTKTVNPKVKDDDLPGNHEVIPPTSIERRQPEQSSPQILSIIEALTAKPDLNVELIERMYDLFERQQEREARLASVASMSIMQPEIPVFDKLEAGDRGKWKYTKWEHMHPILMPILAQNHFTLTFETESVGTSQRITAVLEHSMGHQRRASLDVPNDVSGSKNPAQAVVSSVSYGKRVTAMAVLNIATKEEGDLGGMAGSKGSISEEDVATIRRLIRSTGTDEAVFRNAYEVSDIAEMTIKDGRRAITQLGIKAEKKLKEKKRAANKEPGPGSEGEREEREPSGEPEPSES